MQNRCINLSLRYEEKERKRFEKKRKIDTPFRITSNNTFFSSTRETIFPIIQPRHWPTVHLPFRLRPSINHPPPSFQPVKSRVERSISGKPVKIADKFLKREETEFFMKPRWNRTRWQKGAYSQELIIINSISKATRLDSGKLIYTASTLLWIQNSEKSSIHPIFATSSTRRRSGESFRFIALIESRLLI